MLLDTGANRTLGDTSLNPYLTGDVPSRILVKGAFGGTAWPGDRAGILPAYVLNSNGGIATRHDFEIDTVPDTNQTLLAMTDLWDQGFDQD